MVVGSVTRWKNSLQNEDIQSDSLSLLVQVLNIQDMKKPKYRVWYTTVYGLAVETKKAWSMDKLALTKRQKEFLIEIEPIE